MKIKGKQKFTNKKYFSKLENCNIKKIINKIFIFK